MPTMTGKRKDPNEESSPKKRGIRTAKHKELIEDSLPTKSDKKIKQTYCITCHKDVGDKAIFYQWK